MLNHDIYMQRCLQLAALGRQWVAPNPMVGAVLVNNGKVIGEGFHLNFGGQHAEVNAINSVENKELIKDSTIYVSLEPCSHYGKTPPCANLLVEHEISKVVIACLDPNPLVAGKGVNLLKQAGLSVEVGILEKEAKELNKRFINFYTQKRPFISLKWAQTKDGICGREMHSNQSKKITDWYSDLWVHQQRSSEQAILVGFNTAVDDNPLLTNRNWFGKSPLRIVIDLRAELPEHLSLFNDHMPTHVFTLKPKPDNEFVIYHQLKSNKNWHHELLEILYEKKIQSLLVEGGPNTLQYFIDHNIWDEAHVFSSQQLWGHGLKAPSLKSSIEIYHQSLLNDQYSIYIPQHL
jgi:diaminohydroxyphosphoribosylaminopyrimidine deaminase/5-amino-6-(5-phosphoribosylamino)uracil reductase